MIAKLNTQKKINRQVNKKTENETSFGIIRLSTTKFQQMYEIFFIDFKKIPKDNKFNTLFNKNNVKINYGCKGNMQQIIKAHNNK